MSLTTNRTKTLPNLPNPVRGVFYDAGFTLIDSSLNIPEVITRVLQDRGHEIDHNKVSASVPVLGLFMAELESQGERVFSSEALVTELWHRYYTTIAAAVSAAHDLDLTDDDMVAIARDIIHRYTLPDLWQPYPDTLPALQEGRRRGLIQGVISDWGVALTPILHGLGLTDYLDFVVVSAALGVAKPNTHLFDLALSRSKLPAESIVYVGDTYLTDVVGGKGAGIFTVLLDRHGNARQVDVPVVSNLMQLLDLIPI